MHIDAMPGPLYCAFVYCVLILSAFAGDGCAALRLWRMPAWLPSLFISPAGLNEYPSAQAADERS